VPRKPYGHRKALLPQSRRHTFIYDEDWAWLTAFTAPRDEEPLSPGQLIQSVVHAYVTAARAKSQQVPSKSPDVQAAE
jgi:hypothetical protein